MLLFITFEGGEGCGKTVQARALYLRLSRLAIPVVSTHEPGGTALGKRLRRWLKWSAETDISPLIELLMFNASRAQLLLEHVAIRSQERMVIELALARKVAGQCGDMGMILVKHNFHKPILKRDETVLVFVSAATLLDSNTSEIAEVGQACAQAPQLTQSDSRKLLLKLFIM